MRKKSASGVPRLAEAAREAGRITRLAKSAKRAQRLNVRHRVRFASSLAAALLDGLLPHPARLFNVVSNLNIRNGDRGQNEFFRSLLVGH